MKKIFSKELIVLWLSLAALICAALSLNSSLNLLAKKTQEWDMYWGRQRWKKRTWSEIWSYYGFLWPHWYAQLLTCMFREICLEQKILEQVSGEEKPRPVCTAGPRGEESSAVGRPFTLRAVLSRRIVNTIQKRGENLVITHSLLFLESMLTLQ